MYALEQLQQKSLKQLKEIGWQLNVLPASDRRCRQNWIDAIVGVNPPLLQLLEVSPAAFVVEQVQPIIETVETPSAVEVESVPTRPIESKFGRIVHPRPAQEPIAEAPETSTGVEVEQAQEAIEVQVQELHDSVICWECEGSGFLEDGGVVWDCTSCEGGGLLTVSILEQLSDEALQFYYGTTDAREAFERLQKKQEQIAPATEASPGVDVDRAQEPVIETVEASPATSVEQGQEAIKVQAQESIAQAAKNPPAVGVDRAQELLEQAAKTSPGVDLVDDELPGCCNCFGDGYMEDEFGFVKFCPCETEPILSRQRTQRAIGLAAKNFPGSGSKVSTAHQLLELFKSSAQIIENSPGVKTEETESESEIAPATKNHIEEESDQDSILTGVALSDRFLARYSPPQPENIHYKTDTDGQLRLLDFEVESVDEPPDPDDFESLDAFREDLARWDWEHPSSFDHCSDLPNSEHSEPNSENSEPLEVSLDSFCEWAHCPADWYEPTEAIEASKVMELSLVQKNSSTSDFFILTFDRLSDRSNKSDEPPDTGVFAKLPKPKPPRFPALHNRSMLSIARPPGTNIFQLAIGTVLCFK